MNFLLRGRQRTFFLRAGSPEIARSAAVRAPSSSSSLDRTPRTRKIRVAPTQRGAARIVTTVLHRFEQSIAGRPYLIEVAAVTPDRWRACIVRLPGVPTALMPFYGRTPDEAARHLSEWLTRAHQRASSPAAPV